MTNRKGRGTLELPLTPPLSEGAKHRARRTCAMFARNKAELLLFLRQLAYFRWGRKEAIATI